MLCASATPIAASFPSTWRGSAPTSGRTAGVLAPGGAPAPPATSGKPEWEQQWDEWVRAAKQEGQLTIGIGPVTGHEKTLAAFEEAFPGIKVDNQVFQGAGIYAPKVTQERLGGLYAWDVAIFPFQTMLNTLKPAGAFDPIRPVIIRPDVTNNNAWIDGFEDGFRDNEKKWVYVFGEFSHPGFAANRDIVKDNLKSVKDLLDPKWKGRILLSDPRGGSVSWWFAIHQNLGVEVLKQLLVDQQPSFTRDSRQITEALVRGTFPIALLGVKSFLAELQSQGLGKNVGYLDLPEARVVVAASSCLWLMNKAPHPNAARVFVNWMLTQPGQNAWNSTNIGNSRRNDVPPVDLDFVKVPGANIPNASRENTLKAQADVQKLVLDWVR